jgi:Flp pilus assembly pilin Flp
MPSPIAQREPSMKFATTLILDESSATSVEYAVMLALILASCIAAIGLVGSNTGGMWGGIQQNFADHGI